MMVDTPPHRTASPSVRPLTADWLVHRYDPERDMVHLISVDRPRRRQAAFLTDADLAPTEPPVILSRSELVARAGEPSPLHFIFHSAYCCSTLLANAFDIPGVASASKEPVLLNDMVGWRHRGGDPARIGAVLNDGLTMLARPFDQGEAMIVKPSNVVNALIAPILSMRPGSGAVLLYAPLRVYLGSIAKKGMWGRLWVRDLLAKQLRDGTVDLGFGVDDYFLQTDLQVAATGWLSQHAMFATIARRWPARVRTLDSEVLLARPHEAIAAIATLFGLALDTAAVEAVVSGDAFGRNAKSGEAFDRGDRLSAQREATDLHGDEIEKVAVWAEAVAANAGVSMTLPGPLLQP